MLDFDPTESTGFLVGRVAHSLNLRVQEFLDDAGIDLSAEEISILTVLAHLKEPIGMQPLAEKLGRDLTTLSRQISGLDRSGWVLRNSSPDDGRVKLVTISKKGLNLVERTIPLTLALRGRAMNGISKSDAKVLVKSLSQMLQNLRTDS